MAESTDDQQTLSHADGAASQSIEAGNDPKVATDPRRTDHQTGDAQAAANAEDEPAG